MEDKHEHAKASAASWMQSIRDAYDRNHPDYEPENPGESLRESVLEISVRSGWTGWAEKLEPAEYAILLSTGGPAVRIHGRLGLDGEPDMADLQWQDWGTPWTTHYLDTDDEDDEELLLRFAQSFCWEVARS